MPLWTASAVSSNSTCRVAPTTSGRHNLRSCPTASSVDGLMFLWQWQAPGPNLPLHSNRQIPNQQPALCCCVFSSARSGPTLHLKDQNVPKMTKPEGGGETSEKGSTAQLRSGVTSPGRRGNFSTMPPRRDGKTTATARSRDKPASWFGRTLAPNYYYENKADKTRGTCQGFKTRQRLGTVVRGIGHV